MSMMTDTEHVMVVPTELFRSCGYFQGFNPEFEKYTAVLLDPANTCLLYTSPSPRDRQKSRMPSSA